jgi:signal transduction histidine kinase
MPVSNSLDYRTLFTHAPGLLLVLAPDPPTFTILDATDAYLAATLTQREQIVGKSLFEVFPDNPRDPNATGTRNLRESLERVVATRTADTMAVQKYDVRRDPNDGAGFEEKYWSPVNAPVITADGDLSVIIHRVTDVTELVQARELGVRPERPHPMEIDVVARSRELGAANRQLRDVNDRLAELDRAKTVFFGDVSHELRTPLTLILGPIEDCLRDQAGPLPQPARELLELCRANALRLLKLVNRLLDFARIEAGRMTATFVATDLGSLTAQLASVFRSAADTAGIELRVDCPALAEPAFVDRDKWEKIVLNLVSNALKFTLEGRIAVRLDDRGDTLDLIVSDTGAGIPAAELTQVFERFHRVPGTRARTHEGTGIGLALVKELVKLHGGTISVESEVGVGSTFTVTIPRGSASEAGGEAPSDVPAAPTVDRRSVYAAEAAGWLAPEARALTTAPPGSPRVLVADDNADLRAYVASLLGSSCIVELAADGSRALERALEQPPDLVLSDIMMPGLDGLGLLRALRSDARTRDVPVILLSARAGEEAAVEGLDAHADDYLVKPFSARELLARVRSHVELRRSRLAFTRELERANDELGRANKELETFAYSVSHDLRAPLRAIDGFSKILLDRHTGTLDDEGRHFLTRVRAGTARMSQLIDALLDLSRLGRAPLRAENVDLTDVAHNVVEELRRRDPERTVTIEIAEGLGARGDRRLLTIALENLLGNAWKFTGERAAPHIWVGRTSDAPGAFFVRDDGAGFDETYADKLFAPFQRLHGAEFEGTGIGLATVQRIVARHGGRIWARAAVGQGATFFFTLGGPP